MLRLGNIEYSNCYPIHAPLLDGPPSPWLEIRHGTPQELNTLLAAGELDVAPASSIEAARHAREVRVLSGLCIGSAGPVESIVLASTVPPRELDGRVVALPTASASSSVLVRILLGRLYGARPRWSGFRQESQDPLVEGEADAALFIGDVALRRRSPPGETVLDLGEAWTAWTGLPFVYALWQVREDVCHSAEVAELHARLLAARDALPSRARSLAAAAGPGFGLAPDRLEPYWRRICYELDPAALAGLSRFLELAAEMGEVSAPAPKIRLVDEASARDARPGSAAGERRRDDP